MLKWLVFLFLSIIFLITPYQRGLYYSSDLNFVSILLFIMYIGILIRMTVSKDFDPVWKMSPLVILPICYLVSLFSAENPLGAWNSFIQWVFYITFFLLLLWTNTDGNIKKRMPIIFQLTGVWLALIPMLHSADLINYRSSIVVGRFAGVFQYPNTFGLVMGVFALYSLIMMTDSRASLFNKLFFSLPVVLFLTGLIHSSSRGMFIVFPIAWFIGLLLLKNSGRQIFYCLSTIVAGILSIFVYSTMENSGSFQSLLYLLVMSIIFSCFLYLYPTIAKRCKKTNKDLSWWKVPVVLVGMGLLLVLDLFNGGVVSKFLPDSLHNRIETINLSAATAKERLIFLEDGLKMSADSPLIGFGGESWASIYKKYQQLPYLSNKAHNGFLEWILDTGWIGFFIFIAGMGTVLFSIMKNYRQNDDSTLQIATIIGVISIFMHSLLDFNLSYGTVWLMVFWLLASGMSTSPQSGNNSKIKSLSTVLTLCMLTLMVLLAGTYSYRFWKAEQQYRIFKQTESATIKEASLETAISFNPYKTDYWIRLAELPTQNSDIDEKQRKVQEILTRLLMLEPNNSTLYIKAGDLYMKTDSPKSAISLYDRGLAIDDFEKLLYERTIKIKVTEAISMLESGNRADAYELLKSAVANYRKNNEMYNYFLENAPNEQERFNSRDFTVTTQTYYYTTVAYYLLGQYTEVGTLFELQNDRTTESSNMAALAALSLEKSGVDRIEQDTFINNYLKLYPNLLENMADFRNRYDPFLQLKK